MRPPRHRLADVHRDGNEDPLIALAEQLGGRFRPGPRSMAGYGRVAYGYSHSNTDSSGASSVQQRDTLARSEWGE
jgi:hypothetical protein